MLSLGALKRETRQIHSTPTGSLKGEDSQRIRKIIILNREAGGVLPSSDMNNYKNNKR